MPRQQARIAVVFVMLLAASCSTATISSPETSTGPSVPASPVSSSTPRLSRPSHAAATQPGLRSLPFGCSPTEGRCQDLAAGTYVTTGEFAFMPGFTVTLPAGWSSAAQIAGELTLYAVGDPNVNDSLNFWRDIAATDSTGGAAEGVGRTPEAIAEFLAKDPRLIVTERGTAVIGDGLAAISLVIGVDPAGPMDDPEDCPGDSCANFLTDPFYWDGALGITVNSSEDPSMACPCSHAMRLYLASVGSASRPHTLAVAVLVYAPDAAAELEAFEAAVAPIIASVRLPAEVAP